MLSATVDYTIMHDLLVNKSHNASEVGLPVLGRRIIHQNLVMHNGRGKKVIIHDKLRIFLYRKHDLSLSITMILYDNSLDVSQGHVELYRTTRDHARHEISSVIIALDPRKNLMLLSTKQRLA